ncbi:MAG: NAD-dependent succinate-semialdehyde dehydrogenase [Candidatus Eisenbacteria bacterium]|uniref:NAD-dependent succinate-semialdehyde dehydrogenase n=1 Tax=Eiseniibacteriota bacterium TaxID=2212470 RepID=A0A538U560_UNCEI|nr:MAG: NAD-dependent succinate-semialdehyde dehydrogenase [Candidatus Eisenbacteria bacterium]
MHVLNPATGQVLREIPEHDADEVERRLARAVAAFADWRRVPLGERAARLRAAGAVLRPERDALARLMTEEMGKPIAQAEAEVEKCASACDHFAAHGPADLESLTIATDAAESFVRFDPLGPVLAVMPWNFPLWQVFRAAVPALLAGNVVLLKHASNVPGSALAAERVFADAGCPPGVFTTLLIGASAAEALVAHPAIAALTLTGSEAAGIALAARAGAALKKCVLELGGSDAFVVLADADPAHVAAQAVAARTINNGESCIAAKRFIVEEPIAERFEWLFAQRMARLRVGDPMDRATELGPLARADLVDALERQVQESVARGARIVTGGSRLARPGSFYAPTVLAHVTPGMPAFDEETFGPVAAVTRARDARHALELANQSRFGLGASVWTSDPARGRELARDLDAGSVFVNGMVRSDARLPFGGIKHSGHGRELSTFGLREFVNVKTVWVR